MLSVITLEKADDWDGIVKSFGNYDVCYLSGYAKAFSIRGDGEPMLLYYKNGSTRAMNVVFKRDIAVSNPFRDILPKNTFFDLSTPYGYGGFWVEGDAFELVNQAYDRFCIDQGFVSEFVRFHLFGDYRLHYSGMVETRTNNVVRSLDSSLDDILKDFKHKVRKNLQRAEDSGLSIELDATATRLDDFMTVYYGTMDRTEATTDFYFTQEFFEALNEMAGNYMYFHVMYEGQVIATELVLYGTENSYSFLGGTNGDFFHLRPNDFLKYEIIKWAKRQGLRRFVLGGGYGADDGIFRYKRSFAPNGVVPFYIGKRILDKDKYDKLVKLRSDEDISERSMSFFPEYRS
jgi:hypothetical protein